MHDLKIILFVTPTARGYGKTQSPKSTNQPWTLTSCRTAARPCSPSTTPSRRGPSSDRGRRPRRRRGPTARHPHPGGVGALGDGRAGGERRPRQQRHHPRLLRLPGAHVPGTLRSDRPARLSSTTQAAPIQCISSLIAIPLASPSHPKEKRTINPCVSSSSTLPPAPRS